MPTGIGGCELRYLSFGRRRTRRAAGTDVEPFRRGGATASSLVLPGDVRRECCRVLIVANIIARRGRLTRMNAQITGNARSAESRELLSGFSFSTGCDMSWIFGNAPLWTIRCGKRSMR